MSESQARGAARSSNTNCHSRCERITGLNGSGDYYGTGAVTPSGGDDDGDVEAAREESELTEELLSTAEGLAEKGERGGKGE